MAQFEWDLGISFFTEYDVDGFLGVSYDAYGEKKSGIRPAEVHWHGGIGHRPRDPDVDSDGNVKLGANAWWAWEGDRGHANLGSDPRAIPKLPRLKKGGSLYYADTGNPQLPFDTYDGDTGTRTIYVPYAFVNGAPTKAMLIAVNVDNPGHEAISIVHGDGQSVLLNDRTATMKNCAGDAYIQLSDSGGTLAGNWTVTGAMVVGVATPGAAALALPAMTTAMTPSASLKVV